MDLILTHDHTDFDAVASQLGAARLHPGWTPVLGRYLNRNVRNFLTLHWDELPFEHEEDLPPDTTVERVLLVDTSSLPSIGAIERSPPQEIRVVDHHEPREPLPEGWSGSFHRRGSCATIFVEWLAEQGVRLTWVEATLLLLGIHEDTGSLVYAGTTEADARAVTWLMEQGARIETLREFLEHALTERQRTLYRALLEGSEFLEVHGFQLLLAGARSDEYVDDVSSLTRGLRELYDPAAMVIAVEMGGHVQLVARSTREAIDVAELMARFGGGGHPQAAAAFVDDGTLDGVLARLRVLWPEYVRPALVVGDLMSRGRIRTLAQKLTVEEAAERMRRWGHEGFPVVGEDGAVVGVVTRRDVDRALTHRMGRRPVSQVMRKGELALPPDASIERVRRLMTESGVGQIPVVEDGQVVGIITRTDLLEPSDPERVDGRGRRLLERLEAQLPPPTLALLRAVAREAVAQRSSPYLVGGLVRDLILGAPVKDLDIVIEGAAIPVARALAGRHGGRVVSHQRFGTAKWLLDDPDFPPRDALLAEPGLPAHIDLISARTEYYERPTALPQVEHASIRQDLHRRDFTINTLALSIGGDNAGTLLDFYGGLADLEAGVIRVLHSLSFIEDPTRILRAVRFEQRFGFTIEPRSAELLERSLDLLPEVSPDRLRHELFLILGEAAPGRTLARLDELGILALLMPDVRWDRSDDERLARLRAAGYEAPAELLTALIWNPDVPRERIDRIAARLGLSERWRVRLHEIHRLRALEETLTAPELPDSRLDAILAASEDEAIELLAVLTGCAALRARLRRYLDVLRHRELTIDGRALRESALPPGPAYQEILDRIRAAMLDGEAPDEASQRALLAQEVARRLEE